MRPCAILSLLGRIASLGSRSPAYLCTLPAAAGRIDVVAIRIYFMDQTVQLYVIELESFKARDDAIMNGA